MSGEESTRRRHIHALSRLASIARPNHLQTVPLHSAINACVVRVGQVPVGVRLAGGVLRVVLVLVAFVADVPLATLTHSLRIRTWSAALVTSPIACCSTAARVEGSGRRAHRCRRHAPQGPGFGTLQGRNPRDGVLRWCGWLFGDCGSALPGATRARPERATASYRAR